MAKVDCDLNECPHCGKNMDITWGKKSEIVDYDSFVKRYSLQSAFFYMFVRIIATIIFLALLYSFCGW